MTKPDTIRLDLFFTVIGAVLLLFVAAAIWFIPRATGDLFIALAAGRDVMAGRLNAPDNWSFSTGGRVWIDQNWGASVILYLVQKTFGDTGLLGAKVMLLLLCAWFLTLALRKRKIPWSVVTLIVAAIMVSINLYAILRPNLFTLTFSALELWLLFEAFERPRLIWLAALVIVVWANIHPGFIFGLGMIFLMAACVIVSGAIDEGWKHIGKVIKGKWQFIAGAVAALLLSGIANPFGFTNLLFPFTMMKSGVWHNIRDWRPIWETDILSRYSNSIANFILILCVLLILISLRILFASIVYFRPKTKSLPDNKTLLNFKEIALTAFEAILAIVAIMMAILSNRFIVIALIMIAPVLGRQVYWLVRSIMHPWIPLLAMSCIVFVYGLVLVVDNVRNYDPDNPVMNTGPGSLFEKMHYIQPTYNSALTGFINKNEISGNVFSPWEWEGFLRLKSPQLKVFIGGRAQQAYDEDTFNRFLYVSGSDVAPLHGKAPEDVLDSIDAHLIITGTTEISDETILTALNCGNWVIVFADERNLLFVDTSFPATGRIAEQMLADQLVFENAPARAMSMAANLLSRPQAWETQKLVALFSEAFDRAPAWLWGYKSLFDISHRETGLSREVATLLDRQSDRLSGMKTPGSEAASILECRMYIASALRDLALRINDKAMADRETEAYSIAKNLHAELLKKWKQILAD